MFNYIWKKYLPFINILLKKSATEEQVMNLNRVDFERAGTGRKAGYKFTIEFTDGRVSNVISGSPLAVHLAEVMLESENTKKILRGNIYQVSFNTKFQIIIKNITPAESKPEAESKDESNEEEVNEEELISEETH